MGKFDTKEIFIEKARRVHGDKYDYSQVDYVHSKVKVKIYCKYCNTYFWQLPSLHLTGRGCNNCRYIRLGLNSRKTTEEFIQQAKEVHGDIYDYTESKYVNADTKIKIRCKKCNKYFYQTPSAHLNNQGCPYCKESKGEKYISKILTTKNIAFNAQYKFNDCKYKKPLVFDFYIPNYNLCIEFNGEQHYKPIKKFGGEETFKVRQKRDQIKREYCAKNNIVLLEIKYDENIEEKLQEYFKW